MAHIVGAGHVALTVRDMDVSVRWYEALLGWPVIRRSDVGDPGVPLRMLYDPQGSLAISLCEPPDRSGDPFDFRRTGLDHLAFRVADDRELQRSLQRLDALQIDLASRLLSPDSNQELSPSTTSVDDGSLSEFHNETT